MCEVKPGRRCASHTAAEAESAHTTLEIDQPFAPSVDPVTNGRPRFDPSDLPSWDETSEPAQTAGGEAEEHAVTDWSRELDAGAASGERTAPVTDTAPEPDPRAQAVFDGDYESREARYEAYRAELDSATMDLAEAKHWKNYLDTVSQFHQYSFRNQQMIRLQRPNATRCASYKTWQKVGRQVNKGEKSIKIWAPVKYQKTRTDKEGNPVRNEKGEIEKDENLAFRVVSTFDVAQTSGDDYTVRESELSATPPPGFQQDLENAVRAEGYTVRYGPTEKGLDTRGYTSPGAKEVYIRQDLPPAAQVTTLAHELGHIKAGHVEQIEEYSKHRGRMEVEAESIGYVTCRANGMRPQETTQQSATYVGIWGQRTPREELEDTAKTVNSAVKSILGSGLFRNADRSGGKATA